MRFIGFRATAFTSQPNLFHGRNHLRVQAYTSSQTYAHQTAEKHIHQELIHQELRPSAMTIGPRATRHLYHHLILINHNIPLTSTKLLHVSQYTNYLECGQWKLVDEVVIGYIPVCWYPITSPALD